MASRKNINKVTAKKKLSLLLPKIDSIFESEPAVLRINNEPIMIIGDIHGDMQALDSIIEKRNELDCKNVLFLGDYVDRGIQGTEVLLSLFQLKIEDPEHIFLLRGNHEDAGMNFYDGFFEEIGSDMDFLLRIHQTYEKMPVAAVLSGSTFCVHGGINGSESTDTITKDDSSSYLWNDPSNHSGFTPSNRGSTVKEFGPDIVDGFLKANGLKRIVRGHTALNKGYKWGLKGSCFLSFPVLITLETIMMELLLCLRKKNLNCLFFENTYN